VQDSLSLCVVVNGTDHAFQRELGCSCARCKNPNFRANASVSLLLLDRKRELMWHALIDVGAGVVNNLYDNLASYRVPRLDLVFLTHWHSDHVLGLNQLGESLRRTGGSTELIPLWCRWNSFKGFIRNTHSYEVGIFDEQKDEYKPGRFFTLINRTDENETPGELLRPVVAADGKVTVTPVTISHHTADLAGKYCTAGFIVDGPPQRRVAVLWDLDPNNNWINDPDNEAAKALTGLDALFIDCNTWIVDGSTGRPTGHVSFQTLKQYVRNLRPTETVLIHLSGHEDGVGQNGWGWTNAEWEREARRVWGEEGLPGQVRCPNVGWVL